MRHYCSKLIEAKIFTFFNHILTLFPILDSITPDGNSTASIIATSPPARNISIIDMQPISNNAPPIGIVFNISFISQLFP